MNRIFESQLIECLEALENSQPLAPILARYPQDAAALQAALRVAAALPGLPAEPRPAAQSQSRQVLLETAARLRSVPSSRRAPLSGPRLLVPVGLLAAAGLAGIVLVAALASAPGLPLYGLRRAVEGLVIHPAPASPIFSQHSVGEVQALLSSGAAADVQFVGTLESAGGDSYRVSGLPVAVDARTLVESGAQVGDAVQVRGHVEGGSLQAFSIGSSTAEVAASPEPTDDLASRAACDGSSAAPPEAVQVADDAGVTVEEVMAWFCAGNGLGEIREAYAMAAASGMTIDDLMALRASGLGWGDIKGQLGLKGISGGKPCWAGNPDPLPAGCVKPGHGHGNGNGHNGGNNGGGNGNGGGDDPGNGNGQGQDDNGGDAP